jgi:hypothetical protein
VLLGDGERAFGVVGEGLEAREAREGKGTHHPQIQPLLPSHVGLYVCNDTIGHREESKTVGESYEANTINLFANWSL